MTTAGKSDRCTTETAYLTHAGFIGTPAFASPEQFDEPGQQQIDTRSDIYSWARPSGIF